MLIPTAYSALPSPESCHNGVALMGGVQAQMASSLAQLSHAKFRGHARYWVGVNNGADGSGAYRSAVRTRGLTTYKTLDDYSFLYRTTPITEWIVISLTHTPYYQSDGYVDVNDLLILIADWGTCTDNYAGDLNEDGTVDIEDLLVLIAAWGPCE